MTEGEAVKAGQDIVILESMKMEIPIAAEEDGIVKKSSYSRRRLCE